MKVKNLKQHIHEDTVYKGVRYHVSHQIPLSECVFRPHSEGFYRFYVEARKQFNEGKLEVTDSFDRELMETDIGERVVYEGQIVPLDCPLMEVEEGFVADTVKAVKLLHKYSKTGKDKDAFEAIKFGWDYVKNPKVKKLIVDLVKKVSTENGYPDWDETVKYIKKNTDIDISKIEEMTEEKEVELNSPKRGGNKKFYVYVKNDKGNVIKVEFGDTSGLKAKIDDPEARKNFAARHQCDTKKDKTKPGYWACRLPYYAKQLGLSGGGNFFW